MNYRLYIKEINRKCPIPAEDLEKIIDTVYKITGKAGGDVSLVVCDDEFISDLNKKYKNREGPTNVLSFSMREGNFFELNEEILPIGDIIISVDTVKKQIDDFGEDFETLFKRLFIHGLLHLLGYTHDTEEEEVFMNNLTDRILMEVKQR